MNNIMLICLKTGNFCFLLIFHCSFVQHIKLLIYIMWFEAVQKKFISVFTVKWTLNELLSWAQTNTGLRAFQLFCFIPDSLKSIKSKKLWTWIFNFKEWALYKKLRTVIKKLSINIIWMFIKHTCTVCLLQAGRRFPSSFCTTRLERC